MGEAVVNFTLYHTDNDPSTNTTNTQRVEMKVYGRSPANLKATYFLEQLYLQLMVQTETHSQSQRW